MNGETYPLRGNRSYAIRKGRLTNAQARALLSLERYSIPAEGLIDFDQLFGREARRIVEIGSGMGDATLDIAVRFPDVDFLAIEVFPPGIGNLIARMEAENVYNLKIAQTDAVALFQSRIPKGSVDGVHLFFPDPWPKKRHHKRRLVQPPFVSLLTQALKPGGYLHCATDWADYADQMVNVLDGTENLIRLTEEEVTNRSMRRLTKFEAKGLEKGHQIVDLIYQLADGARR